MALHTAENRGYRELYLTSRQATRRLARLAGAFPGRPPEPALRGAVEALHELIGELRSVTARYDLHSRPAAEGGGAGIGLFRGAVLDRFLERNQALRLAVADLEHIATLLAYLAEIGESRGEAELAEPCRRWERRLRRRLGAVRRAAVELGREPDFAVEPLDASPPGRAAHRVAWAIGTLGEWTDRRTARQRGG